MPLLWSLPGRHLSHMKGTVHTCMCRIEAVRQRRRADIQLPGLHNLELHNLELRILARLRPDIPAHPKLHNPEHPAASLHRTDNQGGLHTGDADEPFRARSAGGKCAPNGYGDEERDAGVQDGQVHDALVWRAFLLRFAE